MLSIFLLWFPTTKDLWKPWLPLSRSTYEVPPVGWSIIWPFQTQGIDILLHLAAEWFLVCQRFMGWVFSWRVLVADFFRIESTNPRSLNYRISSIYGIFIYIWLILMVNVGKYTIHGSYGNNWWDKFITERPASWVIPSLVDHHCFKLWTWSNSAMQEDNNNG